MSIGDLELTSAISQATPVPTRRRSVGRVWLAWLGAWLALLPLALTRAGVLAESDTFWQVRTGLLIIDTGRIPTTDPFSWTAAGRAWVLNSWGFDVIAGAAYRLGGLTAVALINVALIMVMFAGVLLLARRLGATPGAAAVVLLLLSPFVIPWLNMRPQLLDYAAVPALLVLADIALATATTTRRRIAAVGGMAILHAVWVNLHAAAVLGVVLCFGVTLAHLCRARVTGGAPSAWFTLGWGSGAVLAALLGTLMSPYGHGVLTQAQDVRAASSFVLEWQNGMALDWTGYLMLAVAIAAAAVAWTRRDVPYLVVIAVLFVGTGFAIRFLPILTFVALPMIASAGSVPAVSSRVARFTHLLRPALAIGIIGFCLSAAVLLPHIGATNFPLTAIRSLPLGCRLYNSYLVGGPVILLRPDVLVSLDSRSDLYGKADLERLNRMSPEGLRELGVTCVIIGRDSALVAGLRADPAWRETLIDHQHILFLPSAAA